MFSLTNSLFHVKSHLYLNDHNMKYDEGSTPSLNLPMNICPNRSDAMQML